MFVHCMLITCEHIYVNYSTFPVCVYFDIRLVIENLNLKNKFNFAVIISDEKESFVLFVIFVIGHFYYMFVCNYIGQKIIDNSTGISRKT